MRLVSGSVGVAVVRIDQIRQPAMVDGGPVTLALPPYATYSLETSQETRNLIGAPVPRNAAQSKDSARAAPRASGSACCRVAASIWPIHRRSMSRLKTLPTVLPAWPAGTARHWAIMPFRWPSTACWSLISSTSWPAGKRPPICALLPFCMTVPEYVIGDMISPFKALLGDGYRAIEARLAAAINLRHQLPAELPAPMYRAIKQADSHFCLSGSLAACRLCPARGDANCSARRRPIFWPSPCSPCRPAQPRRRFWNAMPGCSRRIWRIAPRRCRGSEAMTLYVCSLSAIQRCCRPHRRLAPADRHQRRNAGRPAKSIAPDNHLYLEFNDITAPAQGLVPPSPEHVEKILAFGRAWDRKAPMVVHCWAGVSRSTAAGYILSHALTPGSDPHDLARLLRARAPWATPNGRMISACRSGAGRQRRHEGCHCRHRPRRHGL
jgi:predicted protein tyrosine phosphatase